MARHAETGFVILVGETGMRSSRRANALKAHYAAGM
jgi:hypothetical protein